MVMMVIIKIVATPDEYENDIDDTDVTAPPDEYENNVNNE